MRKEPIMEQAVRVALEKNRRKEIDYPAFAQLLREAGVRSYRADVPAHAITYEGEGESFTETGREIVPAAERSPRTYDPEGIRAALAANQRGKGDYEEFLRQIWAAGVTHYDVDLQAATVTYRGAQGEAWVEPIPPSAG
jgi:uncharacterized protein YbcV (DUF1398 family)